MQISHIRYASDPTQGPQCALACPAATVYRNYFVSSESISRNRGCGSGGASSGDGSTMCASGVAIVSSSEGGRSMYASGITCSGDSECSARDDATCGHGKGQRGIHQLNLLEDVERVMGNTVNKYWDVLNGYCLPVSSESMARLCARLAPAGRKTACKGTRDSLSEESSVLCLSPPSLATEVYNALVSEGHQY